MNIFNRIKNGLSQGQFIALGFAIIIVMGTLLLMLPFSTKAGQTTGVLDALFTATSATCVTGLVVADTFTHWTLFGQLVILCMIQCGGLGFMIIGMLFALILKRRVSLRDRGLLQESVSTLQIGGIVRLAKRILMGTIIFEGMGAVALSIRFMHDMPIGKAIYYGIFHSVSAFCNAGFDLMGYITPYNSLCGYEGDYVINITVSLLILVGGIGFIVWDDIAKNKFHVRKYLLHTKICLSFTVFLVIVGTLIFLVLENNNLLAGKDMHTKILASLFSGVTARTAGFNTIDTGTLTNGSKLQTMILMFIGGCPGSTAGGVKTTTIFVLFYFLYANIKNEYGVNIFRRRLDDEILKKAALVVSINVFLFLTAAVVIMMVQPELGFSDVLFEVISAIDTVGMTTGITRDLNTVSRIAIMILMYCGRIGSLTFALSFTTKKKIAPVLNPSEKINVG